MVSVHHHICKSQQGNEVTLPFLREEGKYVLQSTNAEFSFGKVLIVAIIKKHFPFGGGEERCGLVLTNGAAVSKGVIISGCCCACELNSWDR